MRIPPAPFRPERADWTQAALVAIAIFAVYALSAPRTVAMEDDGLFILSSYFLGIEHPPGYPLFTLIGHLFSKLPFGSVAYRVHLASAMFGALSGAMAWLCARALVPGRLPAYLAAFGLGLSPVFWSQAIIAEVYTLNTFLFLVLLYLGLRVCPPGAAAEAPTPSARGYLAGMAFVFGLSLCNHYPLMLLVAPAFAILLWPLRGVLVRNVGLLMWLLICGLLPYLWLVHRSGLGLVISFYGPMETLQELWFFVSRAGYADIDASLTASWLDRIKLFQFQASELFVQFAVIGTLLAATGVAVQWRVLGRRVATTLTVAFLMSTFVLLLLLGFDYDSMRKHVYHVYPLPAYAVAALWMALGFGWLVERFAISGVRAVAGAAIALAAVAVVGVRYNVFEDHEWGARYAQAVLELLPRNATVIARGDPDLAPIGYFHLIEGRRPDITLVQPKGLILGNRLFHPLRTDEKTANRLLKEMVAEQSDPVVSTFDAYPFGPLRDRWIYAEVDKSQSDPKSITVDIPENAIRFFETSVMETKSSNAWVAFIQGELRRKFAVLLARSLPRDAPPDARTVRIFDALGNDFFGALGIAEGLMMNPNGYSAGVVRNYLDRSRDLMPSDVTKQFLARYFNIRGALRANLGDRPGAISDLDAAVSLWLAPTNPAVVTLEDLLRETGDTAALERLKERTRRLKRLPD